jgi:heptosyltransferase-1
VRVLIVKLSSLGDVVHTMPVVHDIRAAHPGAMIDWVVEPGLGPLVRRVQGVDGVIECALRRWRNAWWTQPVRREWRVFRERLQRERYDAVIDLQGLTKSALIARLAHGVSYGLANRTEGSGFEWPARWLVQRAIRIEPRVHVVDRARTLVARALGYAFDGPPRYGLRAAPTASRSDRPMVVFVHGSSRDDKLWPQAHWIALGKRLLAAGWRIALPQGSEGEQTRAEMIAAALQFERATQVEVWPTLRLDAVIDRLALAQGVIGVDSGLSHVAVALNLPHVQIYNFATAWRTGPLAAHGHRHQVAVVGQTVPTLDVVWKAWNQVLEAPRS